MSVARLCMSRDRLIELLLGRGGSKGSNFGI